MVYSIVDIDGVRVENNRLYVDPGYTISGTLVVDENGRLLVDTGVTISGGKMEVHDDNIQDIVDGNSQVQSVMFGSSFTEFGDLDNIHRIGVDGIDSSYLRISSKKQEETLELMLIELKKMNIYFSQIVEDVVTTEDLGEIS
jgi:hypothetical protein